MMKNVLWMTTLAVLLVVAVGCSSKGSELGKSQGPVSTHEYPPAPGAAGAGGGAGSGSGPTK